MTAVRPSVNDVIWPTADLQKILGKVYDSYRRLDDPAVNAACRQDFIFHMTDWLADLRRLSELYNHPNRIKRAEADAAVFGFLIHAVPHLMAAGRLFLGKEMTHPFDYPDGLR